nr:hypothetical protein BACY1_00520 [Tenacibaculum mesophilum]
MKISEFIIDLKKNHDLKIVLKDEKLRVNGKKENLTSEIVTQIKERKEEIVNYYKSIRSAKETISIPKAAPKAFYPLSNVQSTIYFRYEFDQNSLAFNMPKLIKCHGLLDIDKLTASFNKLIKRHESLRTNFIIHEGASVQVVRDNAEIAIEVVESTEDNVKSVLKDFIKPFKLDNDLLIRVGIIKVDEQNYLMIDSHHIVNDGVSDGIIIKDLVAIYNGVELEELKIQFKDYSEWENSEEQQDKMKKNVDYWTSIFKNIYTSLQLPYDYNRSSSFSNDSGGVGILNLGEELSEKIRDYANEENVTVFMVFMAAFNVFLSRLSNQEDVVVGVTTAGRNHSDLEEVIGMFVKSLPIYNKIDFDASFVDFLKEVKDSTVKSFDHQNCDFDKVAETLNMKRIPGRNRWFDVMIVYHNYDHPTIEIEGIKVEPMVIDFSVAKFDLTFNIEETKKGYVSFFEYASDLFNPATIEQFGQYMENILRSVVSNKSIRLKEIPLIPEENKLINPKSTLVERDPTITILDLFEEQVQLNPNRAAVLFEDEEISFSELNNAVNQLSNWMLENFEIKADDIIGVYIDRGIDMIISLLAVLKSGAGYTPIDKELNESRVQDIISITNLKFIISDESDGLKAIIEEAKIVNLNEINKELQRSSESTPNISINQRNLSYCIFTSGSTGKPKGISIEHRSLLDFCLTTQEIFNLNKEDRVIQQASLSFDTSVEEIFPSLISGASLVVLPEKGADIFAIIDAVKTKKANVLSTVPVVLNELNKFTEELESLRLIITGGDKLSGSQIDKLINHCDIYQTYGPSEVTVGITCGRLYSPDQATNIGKPISNRSVYILGIEDTICPVNVPGELCVSGIGLAREYLNAPELTAAKFVDNPYEPGNKMYRTGDLVKWLPNGDIEFIGRIDNQFKIGGIRIEPKEIEINLLELPEIEETAVIALENGQEKSIMAYYTGKKELSSQDIFSHLLKKLPPYMIPSNFMWMESFPRHISGKLNAASLPKPSIKASDNFVAPRNESETLLASIWSEVLKIEKVGIKDNFFSLGGDSIKSLQITTNLRMRGYILKIKDIFELQTIEEIVKRLKKEDQSKNPNKEQRFSIIDEARLKSILDSQEENDGINLNVVNKLDKKFEIEYIYPLSPMQQGMLFHSLLNESSSEYFSQVKFQVKDTLDVALVKKSFEDIVNRHEVLRANIFHQGFEKPVQIILKNKTIDFNHIDARQYNESEKSEVISKYLIEDEKRGFNLSEDNLFRLILIQLENDNFTMIWSYHHIILDGWCMPQIIGEFQHSYFQYLKGSIPTLSDAVSYSNFIDWLSNFDNDSSHEFWKEYLKDYSTPVGIPSKGNNNKEHIPNHKEHRFQVAESITKELKKISVQNSVTPNTIFQVAWGILLSKYNNTSDIVYGTVVSGRPSEIDNVNDIVGVFINTIPVRISFDEETSITNVLRKTQSLALESLEYLHYPLANIQNTSELKSELFTHIMAYQNLPVNSSSSSESSFNISDVTSLNRTSYGLWVIVNPLDHFEVSINYDAELYDEKVIQRIEHHLLQIFKAFVEDYNTKVYDIDILTSPERTQILHEFNDTKKEYSRSKLIHEYFEEQVVLTPEHIAITANNASFSYEWLNVEANKFAHYLRESGVERNDSIAVIMNRGIELIVSLFGILKAGGKYVPIEPYVPDNRKIISLNIAEARFVITDDNNKSFLEDNNIHELDTVAEMFTINYSNEKLHYQALNANVTVAIDNYSSSNPIPVADSEDLAYIIFTSGSTGNPKGVAVQHRPVNNLIEWVNNEYSVNNTDKILMVSSVSFDLSVYDLFGGLGAGVTIRIANEEELKDPEMLADIILQDKITFWDSAPAMLQQVVPFLEQRREETQVEGTLRLSFNSGDWIPLGLPDKMKNLFNNYQFVGLGGATEATIWSNYFNVEKVQDDWKSIPYGKPIQNAKYLILDDALNLCPIGVKGNLFIGGECLAQSYFNEKELSANSFIDSPFYENEKLYRTGDIARWFEDGNIEFCGRKDSQVKIRGYRIELGEVEKSLLSINEISHVVAQVLKRSKYDNYICAYYISEKEFSKQELDTYLGKHLPQYMLPSFYIKMDQIPITSNGKINRKLLPNPMDNLENREIKKPTSEHENEVLQIIGELLNLDAESIDLEDNFFDIGGHSLLAVRLTGMIEKKFNCHVGIREIFGLENIRKLAALIIDKKEEVITLTQVKNIGKQEKYVVSHAQERIFYHFLVNQDDLLYNIPLAYEVGLEVDNEKIKVAVEKLIQRHSELRTRFELDASGIVQIVEENVEVPIEISTIHNQEYDAVELFNNFRKPFDLLQAPLIKFKIIETPSKKYFFAEVHHIISDGISLNILMNEFKSLYAGKQLEEVPLRYVDYAFWQRNEGNTTYEAMKTYWTNQLTGPFTKLELPIEVNHINSDTKAAISEVVISEYEYQKFKDFTAKEDVTEYMVLLTAFYLLLHKISGNENIIIETDAIGRTHSDLHDVLGSFINIVALCQSIDVNKQYKEFLNETKATVLEAFENQELQFNEVVQLLKESGINTDDIIGRVHFAFSNYFDEGNENDFNFKALKLNDNYSSQYDLKIEAQIEDNQLKLYFIYKEALFNADTISFLMKYYNDIVSNIVNNSELNIKNLL